MPIHRLQGSQTNDHADLLGDGRLIISQHGMHPSVWNKAVLPMAMVSHAPRYDMMEVSHTRDLRDYRATYRVPVPLPIFVVLKPFEHLGYFERMIEMGLNIGYVEDPNRGDNYFAEGYPSFGAVQMDSTALMTLKMMMSE